MIDARKLKLLLLERIKPSEQQNTLLVAAAIGVLGALATIGFREIVSVLEQLLFGRSDSLVKTAESLMWWQRLLYPSLGGVCAGLLLQVANRLQDRKVAGDYMEAISLGDGRIPAKLSLIKAGSSALSIVSGGSIGREGSMVQLSALTGSIIGQLRHTPKTRRRLLVACGAAAGITAAYNAPIAGALFVSEIVLRTIAVESLGPLLVASVMANVTVHRFLGFGSVYHMPALHMNFGADVMVYAVLGIFAGLTSPVFLKILEFAKRGFARLPWPLWLKLGAGGLLVGAISIPAPDVWGNGYSVVNSILQGGWAWQALLAILFWKVLATAATTGSGAVGGVFTPTLFVGAASGALFGGVVHFLWPAASPAPAFVAVGMGAFLSATIHAPLTAALMIFEMTENYDLIIPLTLACVLAFIISRALLPRSVYAHSLSVAANVPLPAHSVMDVLRLHPPTVKPDQSIGEIEREFLQRRWQHVYVVDDDGRFQGALSLHDFGPYLRSGAPPDAKLPPRLIRADYPRIAESMRLGNVLEIFAEHPGERLPVVTADGRLKGFVSKTDLMLLLSESVAGNG